MSIKNSGPDDQRNSEYLEKGVDLDPATDSGQLIALRERLDTGSKSWGDVQKDKHQYDHQSSFPSCSTARTTFYAREADGEKEEKYDKLFLLHHGRQHPAERRPNGFDEEWEGQKVRQEDVWKFRRASLLISRVGITDPIKRWAVQRLMRENLKWFNASHQGIDGAAIGFAALYKYDEAEKAKESDLVDRAEDILGLDGEKLVKDVWNKYKNNS